MPQSIDTQGFPGIEGTAVRLEGRTSRTPVQQALIGKICTFKKTIRFGWSSFCTITAAFKPFPATGTPCGIAAWGKEEQRNDRAFGPKAGREGYGACDDARPPAAHPSSPRDNHPCVSATFWTLFCRKVLGFGAVRVSGLS